MELWQMTILGVCAVALVGLIWARMNEKKKTA
jgi:hypothetical protein